jgi:hypothetical protein
MSGQTGNGTAAINATDWSGVMKASRPALNASRAL